MKGLTGDAMEDGLKAKELNTAGESRTGEADEGTPSYVEKIFLEPLNLPPQTRKKFLRYAKRLFGGPLVLAPLSRKEFLREALIVLFVRQPIAAIIALPSIFLFDESMVPDVVKLLYFIILLTALASVPLPYLRLVYWRTLGTILPFPRLILCLVFFTWITLFRVLQNSPWDSTYYFFYCLIKKRVHNHALIFAYFVAHILSTGCLPAAYFGLQAFAYPHIRHQGNSAGKNLFLFPHKALRIFPIIHFRAAWFRQAIEFVFCCDP